MEIIPLVKINFKCKAYFSEYLVLMFYMELIILSLCFPGITNINCSGHIWVEPATIFKMGMNISIYCQAAIKNCQPRKLYFYKNGFKERFHITRINKTTARLWYNNFVEPQAFVYCTAECSRYSPETLICGKDISSGCKCWGAFKSQVKVSLTINWQLPILSKNRGKLIYFTSYISLM